jgi:hypothetical protein
MPTVDKAYLTLNFSEFADVDSQRVEDLNPVAELFVDQGVFGDLYKYALTVYIAHLLKLDKQRGKGMVTEQRVGPVSKSYTSPQAGSSELSLTVYGTMFSRMATAATAGGVPPTSMEYVGPQNG